MTYPASPNDAGSPRVRPDSGRFWAGAVATAVVAALIALVAAALLYLLMQGTPQPGLFFTWIMGLATLAAVVYPFSTSAPLNQKGATAVVDLVLGIAITSLLTGVAARSLRRVGPPPPPPLSRTVRQRYEYEYEPTQPVNIPPSRTPPDWE